MTDQRIIDVIAEVLDAMPADARPVTLVNRDRAAKALDALRSNRIAVVELPDEMPEAARLVNVPSNIRQQPMWEVGCAWATIETDGDIYFETAGSKSSYGSITSPDPARELSAVLLAAAKAQEEQ